jgi:EmrB/QacA subfamily drug resistance transporter
MANIETGQQPRRADHATGSAANPRRWWTLVATSFGLFMVLLDITIVNVALPVIGRSLGASFAELQWVIDAYTLVLAVLIVTGGRLGDLFGRKRLFILGLGIFSLGSLLCGLSGTLTPPGLSPVHVLLGARALQGVGGAIMLPLALAIIAATFQGKERGLAFGIYGGVSALGVAIGPLIGGLLVAGVGWQAIFYVNVPVGIIAMLLCLWAVSESRDEHASRKVDIPGLLTLTLGLFSFVLALIQGSDKGWTSAYILGLFANAAFWLIVFTLIERRVRQPMIDLGLFKNTRFTGACLVAFSLSAGLYGLIFYLTLYLQNFLGFSALGAGVRTLTFTAPILIASPLAGALGERLGARRIMSFSLALLVVAVLLMLRVSPQDTPADWVVLLPAFLIAGIASGFLNPPIATVAMGAVSRAKTGMASGINNVFRQLGVAFGVAFLGALLSSRYDTLLQHHLSKLTLPNLSAAAQAHTLQQITTGLQKAGTFVGSTGLNPPPAQFAQWAQQPFFQQIQNAVRNSFIGGLETAFWVAALLLFGGLVAALVLVRKPRE